jgi:hypothetical protein
MKKLKKLILLGITAGAMCSLAGCGSTTVDLDKYITFNESGYNSMGTVSYTFDYDQFESDYADKIKVSSNASDLGLLIGETSSELLLDTCVGESLDKSSGLSNGDTVTLKWNCDDNAASEYFNVTLKYSDIEYEVSNLETVDLFNPFDYVDISFSGISPQGTLTITPNYDQSEIQYVTFSADNKSDLKLGDTVTVTAVMSCSADDFVAKFGSVLSQTEQTYTVDGISEYITDISEIPSDIYDKMDKALQDDLAADYVSWNNDTLKDITLLGNYMLSCKDGAWALTYNYVYFVYKVTVDIDSADGDFNYYWYGYYKDVAVLEDGTLSVDISDYTVPSTGWFALEVIEFQDKYYYGFEDLNSLYNEHVVDKISSYEYKSTVQE